MSSGLASDPMRLMRNHVISTITSTTSPSSTTSSSTTSASAAASTSFSQRFYTDERVVKTAAVPTALGKVSTRVDFVSALCIKR